MNHAADPHPQQPHGQQLVVWNEATGQFVVWLEEQQYPVQALVAPIDPFPVQAPPAPVEIPQEEYRANGAQTLYIASQAAIEFWVNGHKGIRVTDALDENYVGLDDPNARLLESVRDKVSIRIEVAGYTSFVTQKYVRRTTEGRESISRRRLATKLAEVVKAFVQKNSGVTPQGLNRLQFGPGYIQLEDIYLLEVRHVSKGSLQPILAYIPRYN
ncbi:hypothetical protein BDY19DRAFT_445710 [Irpex rosettiformis]|uniref:Uncharacterized protein n=1 Tax=Irpex rosettiformis TaxID=378272 RepID=A0ACB8TTR6_9APHY|nr:hypothetical protein BDY19DRAFT_445710 [Irpex rosettiformis]